MKRIAFWRNAPRYGAGITGYYAISTNSCEAGFLRLSFLAHFNGTPATNGMEARLLLTCSRERL